MRGLLSTALLEEVLVDTTVVILLDIPRFRKLRSGNPDPIRKALVDSLSLAFFDKITLDCMALSTF